MNRERTIEEISETCNKACEIIRRTNDGDLLTPKHLYLTECAVNGFLTVEGQKAFDELYHSVMDGKYVKPYLHDIEHITCDNIGYVYYKGINIEHYDRRVIYSAKAKNYFLKLQRRCAFLESIGVEISSGSVDDMNVKVQKLYDGEITETEYDELTEQFPAKAWVY